LKCGVDVKKVSIILIIAILAGMFACYVSAEENYIPLSRVSIAGDFDDLYAPGVTMELSYYENEEIDIEKSVISWYTCSSENGNFDIISGATGLKLKLSATEGGKYLKAGITPVSTDGSKTGSEVFSNVVYVEPALATPTQIYNTAMDDIGWSAYSANVIKADGFELGNNKTKFIVLDAAEDGSDFLVIDDYMDKTDIKSFGGAGLAVGRTLNMDPSDPNNTLAYWLNTTYFNSTNYDTLTTDTSDTVCSAYVGLPKAIVDHIDKDAVWRTERATAPNVSEEYVFRAAITLPSYTEIKMYGNKLMRVPNRQLFTRTVHNAEQMYAIGDYGASGPKHLIGIPITTQGVIRPIFRLKRSFFTENRIEPSKMGENFKTLLATHFTRAELRGLYTDEELTEIGFAGVEVFAKSLEYEDGKIKAAFEFDNSTDSEKDMVIILAVVEGQTNRIIDCDITPIKAGVGINTYNSNEFLIDVSEDQYIRAMVWDSLAGMIPYSKTELSDIVTLKWGETDIMDNYLPDNVNFTVTIESKATGNDQNFDVYAVIDGTEEKFIGSIEGVPGETVSHEMNISGIENGNSNVSIEVYKDNDLVISDNRDILVMEGYTKQFMDEFTTAAINYNYSNNHTVYNYGNDDYDKFKYAGFNTERGGLLWQLFEKEKGVYDFSWVNYFNWMRNLRNDNVSSNVILAGGNPFLYPMWEEHLGMDLSTLDTSIRSVRYKYAPHTQEGIYAFINAYLRYDELFGKNNVTYEVWNEPDQSSFWRPQPHQQDYINLVKAVAASMKAKNYDRNIAGLSIASDSLDNPIEYFELGMYPYINDMSYHNYWTNMGVDDNRFYETKFDRYHNIIVEAGGWKKQSLTENGWPTGSSKSSVSPEVAAENAVKMFTVADAKNSEYFLFGFKDFGRDPNEVEHNWGIITADSTPKLSYIALTQRNIQLRGGVFVGELDLGDSEIRAFVYLKENKPVVQIWDGSAEREEYTITFEGEHLRVNDFYGTLLSKDTDTLTLTKYPSYINGLSHKYVAMAALADLKRDKELYLSKYTDVLPSKHTKAITTAFDNAIKALESPNAESIEAVIDEFDEIGIAIIESAEKGEIEEIVAARSTFELVEAVSTLCVVYMSEYDGAVFEEAPYSVDESKENAETLYRNDNRIMPYSDAILTYAIDTDKKVKGLLESDYEPELIKGYVAGWAKETKVYSDWFEAFSEFEDVIDYGLLIQIPPSSREATEGSEIKIKINANNLSKTTFVGTIKIYDEDGKEIATSDSFTLAEKGHMYFELPFTAKKYGDSDERHLTVSYVTSDGDILMDSPLIVTIN